MKIIPYEYQQLKDKKNSDPLFSIYEVVGMIGTTDPDITNIDYLSLEDLISGEKMSVLAEWLDTTMNASEKEIFNQRIIRNFHWKSTGFRDYSRYREGDGRNRSFYEN